MLLTVYRLALQWTEVSGRVVGQRLGTGILKDDAAIAAEANAGWENLSAVWQGIEAGIMAFCGEAALTGDQLFALAGGLPEIIGRARGCLHGDARADRECQEGVHRQLREAWQLGTEG